jgi:hypothetical protein
MRTQEKVGVDGIVVEAIGLRGISAIPYRRHTRAPERCCKATQPGYTQIIATHNGSNFLLGNRKAWTTHVCHQSRLEKYEQFVEENVFVYIIRSDDLIHRVSLVQSAMSTTGMDTPVFGLWQIVAFHRPGIRGEMFLPRLLLPLDNSLPLKPRFLN